jgi:hypothetical protein
MPNKPAPHPAHFAHGLAGLAKHKNVHLPPGTNEQNVWERICTLMNQLDQQGEGKGRAARRAPAHTPAEDDFAEAAGRGREYTASSPRNAPGELSLTEDIVRRAEVASAHARGLAGGKGAALPADAEAAADIAERAARASASVR